MLPTTNQWTSGGGGLTGSPSADAPAHPVCIRVSLSLFILSLTAAEVRQWRAASLLQGWVVGTWTNMLFISEIIFSLFTLWHVSFTSRNGTGRGAENKPGLLPQHLKILEQELMWRLLQHVHLQQEQSASTQKYEKDTEGIMFSSICAWDIITYYRKCRYTFC